MVNLNKILILKKGPYETNKSIKYFTGCNDEGVIRLLCIKLTQMIGYVKCFDSNQTMYFKAIDNKLLKITRIWGQVSNLMNIQCDCEPVYFDNDKYKKTQINSYGRRVNTNFWGNKILKENVAYKCLLLIVVDSVVRVSKK